MKRVMIFLTDEQYARLEATCEVLEESESDILWSCFADNMDEYLQGNLRREINERMKNHDQN